MIWETVFNVERRRVYHDLFDWKIFFKQDYWHYRYLQDDARFCIRVASHDNDAEIW